MERTSLRQKLEELAEPEYREFSQKLVLDGLPMLGVRLPTLRGLAKEYVKGDWEAVLAQGPETVFEEVMLKGMLIGAVKVSAEQRLELIRKFVPKINNWSLCDSFCVGLKFTQNNRELVWGFLQDYLHGQGEYPIRFGVVMLLDYFLTDEYIGRVLQELAAVRHEGYYVKMAVAWALSKCYVKFPEQTLPLLSAEHLDHETLKKAYQKIIESRQISSAQRDMFRRLRGAL